MKLIHAYSACVSYVDAQIGLLIHALEECGVDENTVICLWGDNGYHLGEHGHWGKSTNYEDATRVPLIIYAPGIGNKTRVNSLTELLDVYPTLCELAELPSPSHLERKSLVPLMRTGDVAIHEAAVSQCSTVDSQMSPHLVSGQLDELATINSPMGRTIRTPRFRYVEWRHATLTDSDRKFGAKVLSIELYDYERDPQERENVANKPTFAAILKQRQMLFDRLHPQLPKRQQ